MAEIEALRVPLGEDLRRFSTLLWQQGLPHRIAEHRDEQVLWVGSDAHAQRLVELYQRHQRGELLEVEPPPSRPARSASSLAQRARSAPMVLVLLALSVLGALITSVDADYRITSLLTFYRMEFIGGGALLSWPKGELWRLITPIFLHFGLLHIAFNGLWLWELGGMIERRHGAVRLLGVVLLVGAASNVAQAMAATSIFGGMSGVLYGLLGYILLWNKLRPEQALPLVPGVALVLLVWLVLCLAGFASLIGAGEIANMAHVSGLACGAVLGLGAALLSSRKSA